MAWHRCLHDKFNIFHLFAALIQLLEHNERAILILFGAVFAPWDGLYIYFFNCAKV